MKKSGKARATGRNGMSKSAAKPASRRKSKKTSSKKTARKGPPPAPQPELTVHDVAALLVRIDTDNPDELEQTRQALDRLARSTREDDAPSAFASERLAEAARMIGEIIGGNSEDPSATLEAVGGTIEAIIEEQECRDLGVTSGASDRSPDENVEEATSVAEGCPEEPAAFTIPEEADAELLPDFVTESRELLEGAEEALLALEADPEDMEAVNTVFRGFHTIKGTAAFLALERISEFAHRAENLLSRMRDREIRCTGGYADLALRSVDALKEFIEAVNLVLQGREASQPDGLSELMRILADPEAAGYSDEDASPAAAPRLGDILVAEGKVERETVEEIAARQGDSPLGVAVVRAEAAPVEDVAKALRTQRRIAGGDKGADSTIRVRTERLDRLIDMVGELVIAQSMVGQDELVLSGANLALQKKVGHTAKIVRELQDMSMSLRMVPLKGMFTKMTRLVRDLSQKNGKHVEFITEGEETEIDRNMVDVISDPLVHMIRNAVDHGIEPPDAREQRGKSRSGTIRLSAYHASGNVVMELADDGKGLDRGKLVEKAMQRGIIETDKGMSDAEVHNLIFEAGFSTADKITDVSGRGVGMDVVRRNVEALQGRVDISSETGKGSVFTIKLPLTLAITDSMLVRVGGERYIIPTHRIIMTFRPEPESLATIVERGELVRLRDEYLPLFRLGRLFEVPGALDDPTEGLLVIVNDGEQRYALLVDELLGQQQVVVKSLGRGIGKVLGISGAAILGDGRVGLILEPSEVAIMARQIGDGFRDPVPVSDAAA